MITSTIYIIQYGRINQTLTKFLTIFTDDKKEAYTGEKNFDVELKNIKFYMKKKIVFTKKFLKSSNLDLNFLL